MNLPARTRILPSLTSLKLLTGCPDDYYSKDKAIPLFFSLFSVVRPIQIFRRFQKKKKVMQKAMKAMTHRFKQFLL